jgi:hypothetical protein
MVLGFVKIVWTAPESGTISISGLLETPYGDSAVWSLSHDETFLTDGVLDAFGGEFGDFFSQGSGGAEILENIPSPPVTKSSWSFTQIIGSSSLSRSLSRPRLAIQSRHLKTCRLPSSQ